MHFDRAIALYDPADHRSLATQFPQDVGVAILSWRHVALWLLGYPDAALADIERALTNARAIEQAATSMFTQAWAAFTQIQCGKYPEASAQLDEVTALAEKKGPFWTLPATIYRGFLLVLTGKASDAIQMLTSSLSASRQSRTTFMLPLRLSYLAKAYADIGHFEEASRFITEALSAIETTGERWFEADADRIAGEIALKSPIPDASKGEVYFERALNVARAQQAKSLELRAAMSMARLWRDQGKREEARELLAPVYGWFTEGFDTLDLKEAKALLDELAA
jgi:predicted ATPase